MNNHNISKVRKQWLVDNGMNPDHSSSWATKLQNLRGRAKSEGKDCDLTFEEFVSIAKDSGISSPDQNGCRKGQYHLARNGDIGAYTKGNCRFIPQEDNIKERDHNGGTESMRISLTGRSKHTHEGYKNGGMKRSKSFTIISPDGILYEGTNMTEFCSTRGLDRNSMCAMCRGLINQHKGWKGTYV